MEGNKKNMDTEQPKENVVENHMLEVPIEKIVPNELNNFDISDPNERLKYSVKTWGLHGSLAAIGPFDDGTYRLISGERRFHAIKSIYEETDGQSYQTVPLLVVGDKNMDEREQAIRLQLSNLDVRELSPDDRREHILGVLQILRELDEENKLDEVVVTGGENGSTPAEKLAGIFRFSKRNALLYEAILKKDEEFPGFMLASSNIPMAKMGALINKIDNLDEEKKNEIHLEEKSLQEKLAEAKTVEEKQAIITKGVLAKTVEDEFDSMNLLKNIERSVNQETADLKDSNITNFHSTVSNSMVDKGSEANEPKSYRDLQGRNYEKDVFEVSGTEEPQTLGVEAVLDDIAESTEDTTSAAKIRESIFIKQMIRWCKEYVKNPYQSDEIVELVDAFQAVIDKHNQKNA